MKIDGINSHNIISSYNKNKVNLNNKPSEINCKDSIQISDIGKSLKNYSLQNGKVENSSNIQEIKIKIDNGTYNVDARLTAQSIVDTIIGDRL